MSELLTDAIPSNLSLNTVTAMIGSKWVKEKPFMPWEIKSLDEEAIKK